MRVPYISLFIIYTAYTALIAVATGYGQTLPNALSQNPQAQSPVTISPIQPASAPTSGLPANVLTPSTTNQLEPGGGSGQPTPFGGAGRGLPGMSGGPPVNSPLGARDPTSNYMRPPTIGPLFCDPALNLPC
jgi:hypothetical protein